jgi:hypothetical protein
VGSDRRDSRFGPPGRERPAAVPSCRSTAPLRPIGHAKPAEG